jgi:hypothetical protein
MKTTIYEFPILTVYPFWTSLLEQTGHCPYDVDGPGPFAIQAGGLIRLSNALVKDHSSASTKLAIRQ